jgi:hypothetical protein
MQWFQQTAGKEEALLVCARKRGSFQVECSMVLVLLKEIGEDYIV